MASSISSCILMVMLSMGSLARAHEADQVLSLSVMEYFAMPQDAQRAVLTHAFSRRLEHARNLHFVADTVREEYESDRGEPVGTARATPRLPDRIDHWQLGTSYRMDITSYGTRAMNEVALVRSLGFDAQEGVSRRTRRGSDDDRHYGRIDMEEPSLIRRNAYRYWLAGECPFRGVFLFRDLLAREDEYRIERAPDEQYVQLTVGFPRGGTRVVVLDPRKGFLPIQSDAYRESVARDGTVRSYSEKFRVEESRLVGDVWMPVVLKIMIDSSAIPGIVTVDSYVVSHIEHGSVTPKDIEVHFPENTDVVDAIRGVTFVAGPDGRPLGGLVEPVFKRIDPREIVGPSSGTGSKGEPVIRGARVSLLYVAIGIVGLVIVVVTMCCSRKAAHGGVEKRH